MKKCRNEGCQNRKSPERAECNSCRGKRRRKEDSLVKPKSPDGKLRILFIDIETKPNLVWTWGLFDQNIGIDQIVEPGGMMCFSAKWYGQDEVEFYSDWGDGKLKMTLEAWRLLDEADVVIHYFGSRFDCPHLNSSFLLEGFPPPSPYKQIDLKLAVSKRFKFTSNKLQFVSQVLGLEGKEEHEGFKLWTRCMDGEGDARERMESYNRRDTELLEEVYEALLPWIPGHPSRNLYEEGHANGCPTCGADSDFLYDAGYAYTKMSRFKQYRCKICDSYFRGTRREASVKITDVSW